MGKKFIVGGTTITNPYAERLAEIDLVNPTSLGALLLIEPMHPLTQWNAGVPADASTVPNLFAASAASLYGTSEGAESVAVDSANLDGTTYGKAERTTLGGLHVIVSQADARVAEASGLAPFFAFLHSAGAQAYQYTHPNNDLYMSIWARVTRIYRTGTVGGTFTSAASVTGTLIRAGSGGNRIVNLTENAAFVSPNASYRYASTSSTGNVFGNNLSLGFAAQSATPPANSTALDDQLLTIGGIGAYNLIRSGVNTAKARWPSVVIYRIYMEDLDVSGRTYAEVDALDFALYTRHVLTAGGRYYGDTLPTSPATIP